MAYLHKHDVDVTIGHGDARRHGYLTTDHIAHEGEVVLVIGGEAYKPSDRTEALSEKPVLVRRLELEATGPDKKGHLFVWDQKCRSSLLRY